MDDLGSPPIEPACRPSTTLSTFERLVVFGPDPADPREPPALLETLLPWPVRLALTLGLWAIAAVWRTSGPGQALAWALAYAGVVAVSLAGSFWLVIFVVNAVLGTLWLVRASLPPPSRTEHPLIWGLFYSIEFANRQVSHIEVFWIWMAVVLTWSPRIDRQLPALCAILLLAPSLLNWAASKVDVEARKFDGTLQVARRPFIYAATLLGLLIVVARSHDRQALDLLPLAIAIVTGALLRLERIRRRAGLRHDRSERVGSFRRAQRRLSRRADVAFGPVAAVLGLVALVGFSIHQRLDQDESLKTALDGPAASPDSCLPEPGGPAKPDVTLFLLADSHSHELGGTRFPGQTELADALEDSALRPVELDVLSAAPVLRFGQIFGDKVKNGPGQILWGHLGDLDDLSCVGELEGAQKVLAAFPPDRLAGIASGNHDVRFTGNFFWSPFWSPACQPEARLDKRVSIQMIKAFIDGTGLGARGGETAEVGGTAWPRWLGGRPGALVTVTPLGTVRDGGKDRGLAAIFLDSTDGQAFDWGIAGLYGTFSMEQDRALRGMVMNLPGRAGNLYQDPIWLVFLHHRLEDMAGPSRKHLEQFLTWLDNGTDRGPTGVALPAGPRLLAVVAAHTHVAETHRRCLGDRVVREIVIGSTVDAPEQAAVLEVGGDEAGRTAARLTTLPTVGRPGFTCSDGGATIDAAECRQMVGSLKSAPECSALFEEKMPGPECSAIEHIPSLAERLRAVASGASAADPEQILAQQKTRARNLLSCICRRGAPGASGPLCVSQAGNPNPFSGNAYRGVVAERARLGGEPAERELACLSWAASSVQRYKAAGMTFAVALRCAFDDANLPAAQESVASLEVTPCP